jgi:hypothetical protein
MRCYVCLRMMYGVGMCGLEDVCKETDKIQRIFCKKKY